MNGKQQDVNNRKIFENMKASYSKATMPEQSVHGMKSRMEFAKAMNRRDRRKSIAKWGIGAAAGFALVLFALPNTSPQIARAMGQVPGLRSVVEVATVCSPKPAAEDREKEAEVAEVEALESSVSMAKNGDNQEEVQESVQEEHTVMQSAPAPETESADKTRLSDVEVTKIADQILAEFKASVQNLESYKDVMIRYEMVDTTDAYFTVKIDCCQSGADGAEWAYYRTVSMETGKIITMKDIFDADSDYLKVISENIKEQMRTQMQEDDSVSYWIDSEEGFREWDFESITDKTDFYINAEGELVVCFDEGEVAPMCMGMVTFTIPEDVTEPLTK